MIEGNGVIIDEVVCTGCQTCVEFCPTDIIRVNATSKAYAAYPDDCQMCFLCAIDCPVKAITIRIKRLSTLPEWSEARGG